MKIEILIVNSQKIAEIVSDSIVIGSLQDAVDLLGECYFMGATTIIVNEENIVKDFFLLKTGIAGEILQKFSNYRIRLAIIGNFKKYTSKSLKDFISESNNSGQIIFVSTKEEAIKIFQKKLNH